MLHYLTGLFLRALPLPIHAPTLPDRWFCHPDYGQNIKPLDCQKAVDQNWPSGKSPIHYYSVEPSSSDGVRLPRTDVYGSCLVSIESAGPESTTPTFRFSPDKMRALAGFVIESCTNHAAGIGGFVTHGFGSAEKYVAAIANDAEEELRNLADGIITDGNFLTISISSAHELEFQPGDTDPAIAAHLSNYARNLSIQFSEQNELVKQKHLLAEAKRLRDRSIDMARGGFLSWWFDLDSHDSSQTSSEEGELDDTASSPPRDSDAKTNSRNMTFECDAELGSPKAVDCDKLAWSGLKRPDAIETLNSETPNIYTAHTCALGISSLAPMTISWAHLLAAFEALNNLCVQNPIINAKGGRAYFGKQDMSSWINGKRDSQTKMNGNATLPVGLNMTVWKHDIGTNADLNCEWQLAMHGKDISKCIPG